MASEAPCESNSSLPSLRLEVHRAAHHHFRGTAHARRRSVDVQTGDLAAERIDEVGVLDSDDAFSVDFLSVVRQRLFRTLDTEGGHHHRLDFGSRFLERDVERSAAADGERLGLVAQIAHFEPSRRRSGNRHGEAALGVGRSTDIGVTDNDRRTDDRHAACIVHITRNGSGLLGLFHRKDDAQRTDVVAQVGACDHPVQRLGEGSRRHVEAGDTVGLDVRARDEQIFGLLLDFGHDFGHRNTVHADRHLRQAAVLRHRRLQPAKTQSEHKKEHERPFRLPENLFIHKFVHFRFR